MMYAVWRRYFPKKLVDGFQLEAGHYRIGPGCYRLCPGTKRQFMRQLATERKQKAQPHTTIEIGKWKTRKLDTEGGDDE